jgi:hypothetical protein
MPIDSSVAELLTAQLFVLVQEAPEPIYFYINSTGIAVRLERQLPAIWRPSSIRWLARQPLGGGHSGCCHPPPPQNNNAATAPRHNPSTARTAKPHRKATASMATSTRPWPCTR